MEKEGFPGSSDGKESSCNAGHSGLIPGWGRCPEEGNGYPLQYSCLESPMDRGAWQATVHGVAKSQTQLKQLSIYAYICLNVSALCSILWLILGLKCVGLSPQNQNIILILCINMMGRKWYLMLKAFYKTLYCCTLKFSLPKKNIKTHL